MMADREWKNITYSANPMYGQGKVDDDNKSGLTLFQ